MLAQGHTHKYSLSKFFFYERPPKTVTSVSGISSTWTGSELLVFLPVAEQAKYGKKNNGSEAYGITKTHK